MAEFVCLWRRPQRPTLTPQRMQETMARYFAWFKEMEAKGHLAQYGQPLEPKAGRVVKGKGEVSDGPYAETKDIVMGYSVIVAKDLDEAVALTRDHPIFDEDGVIEIRPLLKLT